MAPWEDSHKFGHSGSCPVQIALDSGDFLQTLNPVGHVLKGLPNQGLRQIGPLGVPVQQRTRGAIEFRSPGKRHPRRALAAIVTSTTSYDAGGRVRTRTGACESGVPARFRQS
jgi:hypothetical protein